MKQKIFQIIWLLIFIIGFWYFFGDEYWEYQDIKQEEKTYQSKVIESLETFDSDEISQFWKSVELYSTPDLALLDTIVSQIDNAKKLIYVEVYIFTERDIRDALIRAHNRWVDVKILLENNPYKAPYLNDTHYDAFQSAGLDVRWSDPLNYSLNHAKMIIIDESAYISTGNFSYSLFKYNRDLLVFFKNSDFIPILKELFLWDFEHKNIWVYHENLVLSPFDSRTKIENLVASAEKSIDFYFPYMADESLQEAFFDAARNGVELRGIVEKEFYKENITIIDDFTSEGIRISPLEKDKLHAKALLIDWEILYVGSINFSTYSFDENREIGVLIKDDIIIKEFQKIFESDL